MPSSHETQVANLGQAAKRAQVSRAPASVRAVSRGRGRRTRLQTLKEGPQRRAERLCRVRVLEQRQRPLPLGLVECAPRGLPEQLDGIDDAGLRAESPAFASLQRTREQEQADEN